MRRRDAIARKSRATEAPDAPQSTIARKSRATEAPDALQSAIARESRAIASNAASRYTHYRSQAHPSDQPHPIRRKAHIVCVRAARTGGNVRIARDWPSRNGGKCTGKDPSVPSGTRHKSTMIRSWKRIQISRLPLRGRGRRAQQT
jgi:hypothetical protein